MGDRTAFTVMLARCDESDDSQFLLASVMPDSTWFDEEQARARTVEILKGWLRERPGPRTSAFTRDGVGYVAEVTGYPALCRQILYVRRDRLRRTLRGEEFQRHGVLGVETQEATWRHPDLVTDGMIFYGYRDLFDRFDRRWRPPSPVAAVYYTTTPIRSFD